MEITMGVPIWLRIGDTSGISPARKKPAGPVWVIAESSSGLGMALAKAVLRQGHRVVLATLNTAAAQDLADPFPQSRTTSLASFGKPRIGSVLSMFSSTRLVLVISRRWRRVTGRASAERSISTSPTSLRPDRGGY
jgi:hypothetical protein